MEGSRIKRANEMLSTVEVERLNPSVVYQVRFNFSEEMIEDKTIINYEYINVHTITAKDIKRGLIKEKYSLDDEIALINNKSLTDTAALAYDTYQQFRQDCSIIAITIVEYYESV